MSPEKHVLFVDDEEEVLKILVDFFSDEGYTLHTASDKEEALKVVRDYPVDLVFSDLRLSDGSGSDVLAEVKNVRPKAVRMLTSGYLDVRFGTICENHLDGTLYLSKPWDLRSLKNIIAERVNN